MEKRARAVEREALALQQKNSSYTLLSDSEAEAEIQRKPAKSKVRV